MTDLLALTEADLIAGATAAGWSTDGQVHDGRVTWARPDVGPAGGQLRQGSFVRVLPEPLRQAVIAHELVVMTGACPLCGEAWRDLTDAEAASPATTHVDTVNVIPVLEVDDGEVRGRMRPESSGRWGVVHAEGCGATPAAIAFASDECARGASN